MSTNELVTIGFRADYEYIANVNLETCEPLAWAIQRFNYDFLFGSSGTPADGYPVLSKVYININTESDNQCTAFPKLETSQSHEACKYSIHKIQFKTPLNKNY